MPGVREAIEQKAYAEADVEITRVARALERETLSSRGFPPARTAAMSVTRNVAETRPRRSETMSNFLVAAHRAPRARLLEELNYMNLEEIRGFCSERRNPYRIMAESAAAR